MTRIDFIKKYYVRLLTSVLLVSLTVYTVFHVLFSSSGALPTLPVREHTELQVIESEAWLFRDEGILYADGEDGIVSSSLTSGTKVSKGTEVAQVLFAPLGMNRALMQSTLDDLNRRIAILEKSMTTSSDTVNAATGYRDAAKELCAEICRDAALGDWEAIYAKEDEMLAYLNRFSSIVSNNPDAKTALEEAYGLRNSFLEACSVTTIRNDRADRASGTYYDRTEVDGLEAVFTLDALHTLTPASFRELCATTGGTEGGKTVAGKMAYGFDWYLALELRAHEAALLKEGAEISASFPEGEGVSIYMTVERLIPTGDGGAIAVLSSGASPAGFSWSRTQAVELSTGRVEGYNIPSSAMVTLNGVEGVYIFESSMAKFRRVEVLLRKTGYCIVRAYEEAAESELPYLRPNDLVITYGQDTHEGKVYFG